MRNADLAIIGGGPGGYVAAIRSAQLGLKPVVIERDALGGICLNLGCIPSKALLRNAEILSIVKDAARFGIEVANIKADYAKAQTRSRQVVTKLTRGVESLMNKHQIEVVPGTASIKSNSIVEVGGEEIECRNIVIATGSRPKIPPGLKVDGDVVVTYREAILQNDVPGDVVIIGGGAIGVEFATIYMAYGANVTIVEFEDRILPKEDKEISSLLQRSLERKGLTVYVGSKATGLTKLTTGQFSLAVETPDGTRSIPTNRVLVATGIQANTENLGLEDLGVALDRGFITVDDSLKTNVDNVFAIGDVTGIMPLAHVAQAQGTYLAESLAGNNVYALDYQSMPSAVYSTPQVASFGMTEQAANEQGIEHMVGRFPFLANGKALALDEVEGLAKIITSQETGEILGAHLIGHEVTELLGELSLARIMEGTSLEVGAVVNAHPTLSEVVKEAALAVTGSAVHI